MSKCTPGHCLCLQSLRMSSIPQGKIAPLMKSSLIWRDQVCGPSPKFDHRCLGSITQRVHDAPRSSARGCYTRVNSRTSRCLLWNGGGTFSDFSHSAPVPGYQGSQTLPMKRGPGSPALWDRFDAIQPGPGLRPRELQIAIYQACILVGSLLQFIRTDTRP